MAIKIVRADTIRFGVPLILLALVFGCELWLKNRTTAISIYGCSGIIVLMVTIALLFSLMLPYMKWIDY